MARSVFYVPGWWLFIIAGMLEKKQNFFSNHRRKTPVAAAKRPKRVDCIKNGPALRMRFQKDV